MLAANLFLASRISGTADFGPRSRHLASSTRRPNVIMFKRISSHFAVKSPLEPATMALDAGDESPPPAHAQGLEPEAATAKFGLPFILNVPIRCRSHSALAETVVVSPARGGKKAKDADKKEGAELSKEEKKRRRTCKHEGCRNYIVHKGLCCRHGGGKKCTHEGCSTSAKHRGLCWKHGGSVKCQEPGCDKKAKARGRCWAHGGGTKCRNSECSKVAVSGGYCWAHGGGKRCGYDGCVKPAYERTGNLCEMHYEQLNTVTYVEL